MFDNGAVAGVHVVVYSEADGTDLFAVLLCEPDGVHGATVFRTLRYNYHLGQSRLKTVSRHKSATVRFGAERLFREDQSSLTENFFLQGLMLTGVHNVQTGSDNRYRLSIDREAASMGGGVASKSQATHDDLVEFCLAEMLDKSSGRKSIGFAS